MKTSDAILRTLESPNVCDSNLENANVVDVLDRLAHSTAKVAHAIAANAAPGKDPYGGVVASLTEAVMGMTHGLKNIAESIDNLADAVREQREA